MHSRSPLSDSVSRVTRLSETISHRTAGTHATLGLAKREQAKWRRQRGGARHARRLPALSPPAIDSAVQVGGRPLPARHRHSLPVVVLLLAASVHSFGSLHPVHSFGSLLLLTASARCIGSLHQFTASAHGSLHRLTASAHMSQHRLTASAHKVGSSICSAAAVRSRVSTSRSRRCTVGVAVQSSCSQGLTTVMVYNIHVSVKSHTYIRVYTAVYTIQVYIHEPTIPLQRIHADLGSGSALSRGSLAGPRLSPGPTVRQLFRVLGWQATRPAVQNCFKSDLVKTLSELPHA